MKRRQLILLVGLGVVAAIAFVFRERVEITFNMVRQRLAKRTVNDRLTEFGKSARQRLMPHFQTANVGFPPKHIVLLALKAERRLEMYAGDAADSKFVKGYPILAASGGPGPKLREGDNQVPEGIYEIETLNPNSAYHVSLRLNYPNAFDRAQATKEGRTQLGGDIMIHGKAVSIGCIAVGDEAAEELFTLAADVGLKSITVICSPRDFRKEEARPVPQSPSWTTELYQQIATKLTALPTR